MRRFLPVFSFTLVCVLGCATGQPVQQAVDVEANALTAEPYVEQIGGTTVSFEMVPVPAGMMADSTGEATLPTPGFWISATEVTWDLYDVFVFGLDGTSGPAAADAVAKPSKPYVLPGDDYGHAGMPALGMRFRATEKFAEWLSAKTGRQYRVPTEAEWEYACTLSATENLDEVAWYRSNSDGATHPVGSKGEGAIGVFDLLGNAAEWVIGRDSVSVVKGGSHMDRESRVNCETRRTYNKNWQMTDPQIPKSPWWLSDAPFVGIRLIRPADS